MMHDDRARPCAQVHSRDTQCPLLDGHIMTSGLRLWRNSFLSLNPLTSSVSNRAAMSTGSEFF